MITDKEDSDLDYKESVMLPLIFPEDDPHEALSDPTYIDLTSEPGPPSEKPTKEPTL